MKAYTVGQLASMAGVSVRTLHHYDEIGLLTPTARSESGYRLYGEDDLYRLQQVLLYREMGLPLREIGRILDGPSFDQMRALEQHRENLRRQAARLERLLRTVERTIRKLEGEDMPLDDKELYAGFKEEDVERIKRESRERYGDRAVDDSIKRIKGMGKAGWEALQSEMGAVTCALVPFMDRDPGDAEVQALIARHHAVIEQFYEAPAERYAGLADLYVSDPDFRAHYDQYREGLADFLSDAMMHYAITVLSA
ncbi:MAG: TipAS antibiotic-recognition domain-containing protein [Anaerolineae bacterium]|jgi:DNA-binding transcriptional MerR regulator